MRSPPTPLVLPVPVSSASPAVVTARNLPALSSTMQTQLKNVRAWMRKRAGALRLPSRKDTFRALRTVGKSTRRALPAPVEPSFLHLTSTGQDDSCAIEFDTVEQATLAALSYGTEPLCTSIEPVKKEDEPADSSDSEGDEDLLASPRLSPSSSVDSLLPSPPPSPLFETAPALAPAPEPVELIRSAAFATKLTILDDWLVDRLVADVFSVSDALAGRAHGLTLIELEEAYELRYEAASARRFESEEARKQRWEGRIKGRMEEYAWEKAREQAAAAARKAGFLPSPALPRQLQFTCKTATPLAATACTSFVSTPAVAARRRTLTSVPQIPFVDLPSLRAALALPQPKRSLDTYRDRRSTYVEAHGWDQEHLLQWVLEGRPKWVHDGDEEWRAEQLAALQRLQSGRVEEKAEELPAIVEEEEDVGMTDASEEDCDREEDAVDALLSLAFVFPPPPSSSPDAFRLDEDDEDEDYFSSPPVFA
ncbi:hypothetical protein JCM10213_007486 [Rhodosporidiobolus nylandii]